MTKLTTEPMGQQLKDNVKVKLADEVKVDLVDDVIADDENVTPITTTETTCVKIKKKRDASTLRKAPQAPKRFKSSYIMFFMAKQQEIKAELGGGASVGDVSKQSSDRWKKLSLEERAVWDQKAKEDKERYNLEKASYTGPWQVPWKRAKKDPSAPKRPMSAFLFFSQDKRRMIKGENPGMRNTEISRVLGEMWKEASDDQKSPHVEREAKERAKYKLDIAKWRKEDIVRKEEAKKEQIEQAKLAAQNQMHYQSSSNAPGVDESHSYSSEHPLQAQNGPQGMPAQQYYQGSYGYSDYHPSPSQGYGQASQYYDYPPQGGYYNGASPGPHSQYQSTAEVVSSSEAPLSNYPGSNNSSGGAAQYPGHPGAQQQSAHYDRGYYSSHQAQGYHYNPSPVTSYQGEYDAYPPQHTSQPPQTRDISNLSGYP